MNIYAFRQNNTGGTFLQNKQAGIGINVYIEAESVKEANAKAEHIGLYFDGCDAGEDCPCCGDRWYPASEYNIVENTEGREYDSMWGVASFLHKADGTFEEIKVAKDNG